MDVEDEVVELDTEWKHVTRALEAALESLELRKASASIDGSAAEVEQGAGVKVGGKRKLVDSAKHGG